MCMFCHSKETKAGTTTHVVAFDDCVVVIKHVPCWNVSSVEKLFLPMM